MDKREKLVNKCQKGHFAKAGVSYKRYVRELKLDNAEEMQLGQEIKADTFAAGDKVDATAISKGKGFQGAIKRHGLHRGPMAHGSKYHRHAGSNGACSDPSRVFKGKKMAGQTGNRRITVQEPGSGPRGCRGQPDSGKGLCARTQESPGNAEGYRKGVRLL